MKAIGAASLAAIALALAGCGHKAADTTTTETTTNTTVADTGDANTMAADTTAANATAATPAATVGQAFANTAAASDSFEIATSKLALTASSSSAIKRYAQQMIDAHTASTAKLKSTTAGLSPAITPDPTLNAEQQATLDTLKAETGKTFDQAYVAAQTKGHQQTLDALRSYAATGDVPQLKTFATTLTPTVAAHLNMAKALRA